MPITIIESDWRETPMTCSECEYTMYSDGKSLPVCGNENCLHQATLHDVLEWLITEHEAENVTTL